MPTATSLTTPTLAPASLHLLRRQLARRLAAIGAALMCTVWGQPTLAQGLDLDAIQRALDVQASYAAPAGAGASFEVKSIDQVVAEARQQALEEIERYDKENRAWWEGPLLEAKARLAEARARRADLATQYAIAGEYSLEGPELARQLQQAMMAEMGAEQALEAEEMRTAQVRQATEIGKNIALQNAEAAARQAAENAMREQELAQDYARQAAEAAARNQAALEQAMRDAMGQAGTSPDIIDAVADSAVGTAFHCARINRPEDAPGETVLRCQSFSAQAGQ